MKTFSIYTFGCRVNRAEAQKIWKDLSAFGGSFSEENPGLLIVNTCDVTQKAEKESSQAIRSLRRKFPGAKIIVTGCAATAWLRKNKVISEADLVIDNKQKDKILQTIRKLGDLGSDESWVRNNREVKDIFIESGRAFIKIQDGCNRHCTYCIVPCLRGKPKSKTIKKVIREIGEFGGIREAILTAVNTDLYGKDTGESFSDLVEKILRETKVNRLSIGSINPLSINNRFLKSVKNDKFVKYFHIPIQSGSDRILQLMNRGYKATGVKDRISTLPKLGDLVFLGTDIIVGFPGETDQDFEQTYKFLEDSPISKFHIFRFSKREGTAACKLARIIGEPSETIKKQRAKILESLGKRKYQLFLNQHLNKVFPALFLVRETDGYQEVLLTNNVQAYIKISKSLAGTIRNIKIENIRREKIYGKIV